MRAFRWNVTVTFLANALPAIAGLICVRPLYKGLGAESFGLLSIALVVVGYAGLLDLGLGRAIAREIARTKEDDYAERRALWAAASVIACAIGLIAAIVLLAVAMPLVAAFDVAPHGVREAVLAVRLLALAVPATLLSSAARGFLEGAGQFSRSAVIRALSGTVLYVAPALAAISGLGIIGAIAMVVLARWSGFVALAIGLPVPLLSDRTRVAASAKRLLRFGSAVSLSGVASPFLAYLDRLVVGGGAGASAVAMYSIPYDAVTRLWMVSSSYCSVIFPSLSAREPKSESVDAYLAKSVSDLGALLCLPTVIVLLVGEDLLRVWVGPDVASSGGLIARIIAIGVLANSFEYVFSTALVALGRPGLLSTIKVSQAVLYVPTLWFAVRVYGVVGVAVTWLARILLELVLVAVVARITVLSSARAIILGFAATAGYCAAALIAYAAADVVGIPLAFTLAAVLCGGLVLGTHEVAKHLGDA